MWLRAILGGTLRLGDEDVSARTSFTAAEFAQLTYTAGTDGSRQNLVVVAQTGIRQADDTLIRETDSQAVQITADVTGSRSINAMNALMPTNALGDPLTGADADIADIVRGAGIFGGFVGAVRPTLQTDGNFTGVTGDVYRMSDLFKAHAPTGQAIVGYRVALGDVAPGDTGGTLTLGDEDVSARTSFTAAEFAQLTYTAGTDGSRQNLVVAAQTGIRQADDTLIREADSQAVQITADVTGSRSINAMNALMTATGADADIADIVRGAGIFGGFVGAARPTLQTDGNFTAATGDVYRMSDLFKGRAPSGQAIAGYRVALGDVAPGDTGGTLWLGDKDVSDRTSFTADEFAQLTYTAGTDGSQQNLVVVAQTGIRQADDTLIREADSQAVQITADVTGTRSINAMNALMPTNALGDPLTGADADIVDIVRGAGIFGGFVGAARPSLQTDGNFTAVTGDVYRMSDLFKGHAPTGQTIAGYRVALGGDTGGTLRLGDEDVSARTSFTAAEFAQLTYTAGTDGSRQDLVVVAQTGIRQADDTLIRETDSLAVQITADVTGTRSINAMNALMPTNTLGDAVTGADAGIADIVRGAGIFGGFAGATRPTLQTDGNFTAVTGDVYQMSDLFKGRAPTGQSIVGYRVALGDVAPGDTGGTLNLGDQDVSARTSFTADEFAQLTYTAGTDGARQNLVVVAQTGIRQPDDTLIREADSQAVQVTADVTGSRSINAMNALMPTNVLGDPLTGADASIADIVRGAGIFGGFAGSVRPTLQTGVTADPPIAPSALADAPGAYRSAGLNLTDSEIDLSPFYSTAIGSSVSPGTLASNSGTLAAALLLLDGATTAAFRTAGDFTALAQAIRAYTIAKNL